MTHTAATADTAAAQSASGQTDLAPVLPSRKLSVWLFLGSEVMFFSALIVAYIALRATSTSWPTPEEIQHVLNIPLTAINTFILIVSSVAVVMALEAIRRGNQRRMVLWLAVTLALGATFLGIQVYEYRELLAEGLTLTSVPDDMAGRDKLFATTFFTMTSFHGLHVAAGVVTLLIVLIKAWRGHYTQADHEGVELFGLYWHFVDVVWIFLFTIVYLV